MKADKNKVIVLTKNSDLTKKALESNYSRAYFHFNRQNYSILSVTIFFHPDYTVGFGVTPNHALRLVGYTTGRDLHPALKIFMNLKSV